MAATEPVAELDPRYSSEGVSPTPWPEARGLLAAAEVFWLSTVRPDGRPHVTPLLSVWHDGALYFCTGPDSKARNLARNPHCNLTTGCNALDGGLDLVVEGEAVPLIGDAELRRIAGLYESKYGSDWRIEVREGAFFHEGDGRFSQTRWQFEAG